jgi:hypothetical protein
MKTWFIWTIASVVAAAVSASAQAPIDPLTLKLYGGIYSSDCNVSTAPRLRLASDTLIFQAGNRRITGRNVQLAASLFGSSPPPDFEFAFSSDVIKGVGLMFIVYRDPAGQYITLDGHPRVKAAIGTPLYEQKYRRCGGPTNAVPPAVSDARRPESIEGPWTLLVDSRFKSTYYAALGSRIKQDWLARLDGPSQPLEKVVIGGKEYTFASVCKAHECGDNNAVLLYSPAQNVVFGKIVEQRRSVVLGEPPPQILSELERLWIARYGRKP